MLMTRREAPAAGEGGTLTCRFRVRWSAEKAFTIACSAWVTLMHNEA
jgi:hypothetical protein